MKRIQKYFTLLQAVRTANPKTRVAIIRAAPDEFIKALIEVVLNFLNGNLKTSQATVKKLCKHKAKIRRLGRCCGKKGVAAARKQLVQKGGVFPLLIPLIAGLAGIGTIGAGAGIAAHVVPKMAENAARNATNAAIDTVVHRASDAIKKL